MASRRAPVDERRLAHARADDTSGVRALRSRCLSPSSNDVEREYAGMADRPRPAEGAARSSDAPTVATRSGNALGTVVPLATTSNVAAPVGAPLNGMSAYSAAALPPIMQMLVPVKP